MCNQKPSSPSSFISTTTKTHFLNPIKTAMDLPTDDHQDLHRWPNASEAFEEIKEITKISGPTTITGLIIYSRAMISMLFLGYLGELELAGGSLSIGVANITGYSVISGLAMGMDPICGQAYGAKQFKLLGLTLQRTVLLLLTTSIPISFMWLNMKRILLWCNQDEEISETAQNFIVFAVPDLFFLSILHPLRIYLRTQGITLPLTYCSTVSVILHVPLNFCCWIFQDGDFRGRAGNGAHEFESRRPSRRWGFSSRRRRWSRLPLVASLGVSARSQAEAGRQAAGQGAYLDDRVPGLRRGARLRGHAVHDAHAAPVGPVLHGGRGDTRADDGGTADCRALRARELSPDDGVWRPEGECQAHRRGEHQSGIVLPRRDAGGVFYGVRDENGVRRLVARLARGSRLVRAANVVRFGENGLGRSGRES
ncbi:hypothetical protein DH2020_008333 [Rehmannia glutinosa]|uniref:Protein DETOXIFICATION n=1 Tax=Rehmannia glutinosa TaxID=99300 RepID=A0ABR0U0Q3_REHGL